MFYELPSLMNLLVLMLPIIAFRIQDWWFFRHSPEYAGLRRDHGTYWGYRSRAPRNPSRNLLAVQAAWALICFLPLR